MNSLAEILHPYSSQVFLAKIFAKTPLFLKGDVNKFAQLFSWEDLNFLLVTQNLSFPHFRIVRNGQIIPESEYATRVFTTRGQLRNEMSVPKLATLARDKVTFVLDGIDKMCPSIGSLSSGLEYETGARVQCNLYVSYGRTKGFDLHYDDHDVFILQISGDKDWEIRGITRAFPLPKDIQHDKNPPPDVLWQGTISPGDLLYIPRGFWHVATSQDLPSMHITVGINGVSGVDFLEWMGNELRQVDLWRKFLPLHRLSQNAEIDFLKSHFDALKTHMCEFMEDPSLLDRYIQSRIATQKPRGGFNFPDQVLSEKTLTINTHLFRPPYQPFLLVQENDMVILRVWGREFSFKLRARELLDLIFASTKFTPKDILNGLSAKISWKGAKSVFVTLIEEGVIFCV